MDQPMEKQIKEHEERLKQAMVQSDVVILDALLAPDLIFTNHLGQRMSKQEDLEAHRSGMLKIGEITTSDQAIKILDNVAVVSVQARIVGKFADTVSENDYRFTRVWSKSTNNNWQVIAGHSSIVV